MTYRAIVCDQLGPPSLLKLKRLERPRLKPGEVRIAVRAAGVNFPDNLVIAGKYQHKPPLPFVPGFEIAGEIIESEAPGFAPGDRVMTRVQTGGFAEEAVAPAAALSPLPPNFSFAEGAAFLIAAATAGVALIARGRLKAGETLLVHGAGGGVGLTAVEIGALLGARVIACASSEEKRAASLSAGAAQAIPPEGFVERVKELTEGNGADVIYDPVGGDIFQQSLRCIAWEGRLLVIGFTSGILPKAAANRLLLKGASLVGVRAGEYGRYDPPAGRAMQARLLQWAEAGHLRPRIAARFPLERTAEALQMIADRRVVGRLVVEP